MTRSVLFLVPALALAAAAYGCGGTDTGTTGSGGTGGSTTAATTATTGQGGAGGSTTTTTTTTTTTSVSTGTGGSPPTMCSPTSGVVLAISKLYFGDTNPDDTPNKANGWKQYGYDIDGLTTTAASVDVCQPQQGGTKASAYPDGNNGIDNSFGKNILPLLLQFAPTFTSDSNKNVAAGEFTVMLHLEDLMAGTDQSPIVTKLYGSTPLGAPAKFDGTDCWPVAQESLMNAFDPESATVKFPMSSVTANHWDSGSSATFVLSVPSMQGVVTLTIHNAKVTMDLAADHLSATAGIISGVLDTEEFANVVKQVVGANLGFCSGPIVDGILGQIRGASDIMNDGSQNPAKTCNGISIGLGFKMKSVQFGAVGPVTMAGDPPCP